MKKKSILNITISISCLIIFLTTLPLTSKKNLKTIKQETFSKLDKLRIQKKRKLIKYFNNLYNLANKILNDKVMLKYYKQIKKNKSVLNKTMEFNIDKHYAYNYNDFYDVLFVDTCGFILHTIRRESDFNKNIFKDKNLFGNLSKKLKLNKNIYFVDFKKYEPSKEPAAFFIVSIKEKNKHIGWFILQSSINKLNRILTIKDDNTRTSETYLLNKNKYMLSNSRFYDSSTILNIKVDNEASNNAILEKKREEIIYDYRGKRVLSSYEKFKIFNTQWTIISEIDKDEIITEYYKSNQKYLQKNILKYLSKNSYSQDNIILKGKRVDINEYAKVTTNENIFTYGIASCTALVVFLPKNFCYIAHIPPTDIVYERNKILSIFLKKRNDLFKEMFKKIKNFDIYQYQLKKLKFLIIANHKKSFTKIINKILKNKIELSNIKIFYNPKAECANIQSDIKKEEFIINWKNKNYDYIQKEKDVEDLSSIIKKL